MVTYGLFDGQVFRRYTDLLGRSLFSYDLPAGVAGTPLFHIPVARLFLESGIWVSVTLAVTGPDGSQQSWLTLDTPRFYYVDARAAARIDLTTAANTGVTIGENILASGTPPAPGTYLLTVTAALDNQTTGATNPYAVYTHQQKLVVAPGTGGPQSGYHACHPYLSAG